MRRRHLVRLVVELTDSDLRGHEELKLPILSGFWDIFKPWAIKGGISSDLEAGRFDVLIHQSLLFDLHESSESLSEQVRQVLALNAQRTGLISGTKAAIILKMKREDFRKVVEVGEISPRKTIEISSGPKKGIEFDGYAPKDVIELKERLLAATFL